MKASRSSKVSGRVTAGRRCLLRSGMRLAGLAGLALALALPVARALVYETDQEFFANGDLDGDGREDIVVVDRQEGTWRAAYQSSAETLTWSEPRASGFASVDGFSLGRVLATDRDALIFANSAAGRVLVLDASQPDKRGEEITVTPAGFGVGPVTALDVAGIDNTSRHDLLAVTRWNDPPQPIRWETIRNRDGTFVPGGSGAVAGSVSQLNHVIVRRGVCEYAVMMRAGETTDLVAWRMSLGRVRESLEIRDLPTGSRYTAGFFGGGYAVQFITYLPGATTVTVHPVLEFAPGQYRLETPRTHDLSTPIDRVFVIEEHTPPRLLVVYRDRRTAGVFDYNGDTAPAKVSEVNVPLNQEIHGAVTAGREGFMLLSGSGDPSAQFDTYARQDAGYRKVDSGQLTGVNPTLPVANVLLFQDEPFVSPHPVLVQRLRVGDWTSNPAFAAGPPRGVDVVTETFGNATTGLGNAATTRLAPVVAQAGHALANQYRPDISLRTYVPAVGEEVVELRIAPPPGRRRAAVQVSITATPALADVFYQAGSGAVWRRYNGPFWLARDTTLLYYGVLSGGRISPIHTAVYTFALQPDDLDTDRDGVPDYVEIGAGLNPNGGADSDGDGFSDLEELVAGTLPNKAQSLPSDSAHLGAGAAFDLEIVPRPYDGTVPQVTSAQPGLGLRASDLTGRLLDRTRTLASDEGGPAFGRFADVVVDRRHRLLAVVSDPHFAIVTTDADPLRGRELLKLVPVPEVPSLNVAYTFGGGANETEKERWVEAARTAVTALQRPTTHTDAAVTDTLVALLLERKLESLLAILNRRPAGGLTLFPHRPADAQRGTLSNADLAALETRDASGSFRGYSLPALLDGLNQALAKPTDAALQTLNTVATEIYRISSAFSNASPGTYRPPVDVLRAFLETGTLDAAYRAKTTLTAGELALAVAGVNNLLGGLPARPVVQKDLWTTASTGAGDCTVLEDQSHALFNLTLEDGRPYPLPASFELPPGTQVRVTAHTDGPPSACTGQNLQVLTMALIKLASPPGGGLAGGGLEPDGPLSILGDADGDGRSDLQEFFDGTDPRDPASGAAVVAAVGPPLIHVEPGVTEDEVILWWHYPAAYAERVSFQVLHGLSVDGPFEELPGGPWDTAPGEFGLVAPAGERAGFFQVIMRVK